MRNTIYVLLLVAIASCGSSRSPTSPTAMANGSPQIFYVSPGGSDRNNGAIATPYLTLRYAVAQLHAGDTLYLRGGTFAGSNNTIDSALGTVRGGTSWSNAITIAGYPSESVTIVPPAGNWHGIRLTRAEQQYLIFQDLTIDMGHQAGNDAPNAVYLSGGANHNRFSRLDLKNAGNFGLVFSRMNGNSPFNEVVNCRIHDNGTPGGDATTGHGIYVSTSDNLFEGNDIFNNQGYGMHFYDNSGPMYVARNVIRFNQIHGNGVHGGTAYGVVIAWGDRNQVYDNRIYGNPGGIQIYSNSTNAEVHGNTIYGNRPLEGIMIQYATGTEVRDNSIYDNQRDLLDLGVATSFLGNR